jgi:hypothetical protein
MKLTGHPSSTKPGGYVELQDLVPEAFCDDGTMPAEYPAGKWLSKISSGLEKLGVNLHVSLPSPLPLPY